LKQAAGGLEVAIAFVEGGMLQLGIADELGPALVGLYQCASAQWYLEGGCRGIAVEFGDVEG